MKDGIARFLKDHAGRRPVSFHMPGHKGQNLYRRSGYGEFLDGFFDFDITEIDGADNLFQAEGIIAETMEKYRKLYDTEKSYLLVNGTSGGLIAAIMACVPPGKKLIMARNCHKSVFNALRLGGIRPVYAYPEEIREYGIAGQISPEEIRRLLEEEPEAEAVILPSPNYYGICSDIRAIAGVVHRAGKVLIVDQAHGAHLKFFEEAGGALVMPPSAESCGADLVVGSTHKTLASLTQSAVLNVCRGGTFAGENLSENLYRLEDRLQAVESTSPSYILMGSLDINAGILLNHGKELIGEWRENLEWFYREAARIAGLTVMGSSGSSGLCMDRTKINLDMSGRGLNGAALEAELLKRDIYAELVTGNILMCMTGIGNTREDYERLLEGLEEISAGRAQMCEESLRKGDPAKAGESGEAAGPDISGGAAEPGQSGSESPWTRRRDLKALPADMELVPLEEAAGRICASSLIPYPPGIPLICPGEVIEPDDVEYVRSLRGRGEKVIGVDGRGRIAAGRME